MNRGGFGWQEPSQPILSDRDKVRDIWKKALDENPNLFEMIEVNGVWMTPDEAKSLRDELNRRAPK
jgi:hypothetical protein